MKILITEKQIKKVLKSLINEADYSLHLGDLSNANKPYGGGTDNIYTMRGRTTGHFGSGTYLSTYKNENKELYNKYVEGSKYYYRHITKVEKEVYVIDLDKYNLYKPRNTKNAKFLYSTLRLINSLFNILWDSNYLKNGNINYDSKIILRKIINNLTYLNLKLPPLKVFLNSIKTLIAIAENDYESRLPTLATILMEYNGYNGVNVNNIEDWDNTLHGSVIYDLSKVIEKDSTKSQYNKNADDENIDVGYSDKIENKKYKNDFFRKIHRNTTIKEINYYINQLTEPLEKINWSMLEKLLEDGEISKEIYNHISKFYLLKLKNMIINDKKIASELDPYNILLLFKNVNIDFIMKYFDLDSLINIIDKKRLYNDENIMKFINSIDKTKLYGKTLMVYTDIIDIVNEN
jgi:hypothetical protein